MLHVSMYHEAMNGLGIWFTWIHLQWHLTMGCTEVGGLINLLTATNDALWSHGNRLLALTHHHRMAWTAISVHVGIYSSPMPYDSASVSCKRVILAIPTKDQITKMCLSVSRHLYWIKFCINPTLHKATCTVYSTSGCTHKGPKHCITHQSFLLFTLCQGQLIWLNKKAAGFVMRTVHTSALSAFDGVSPGVFIIY